MMRWSTIALAAVVAVVVLLSGAVGGIIAAVFGSDDSPSTASQTALDDIPPEFLALYQRAADLCPGLDWTILAAIGKIESDHGRSTLPGVHSGHNGVLGGVDGARGPLQFLPAAFAEVRRRHPDVGPDVYAPRNAIPAAAWYLCSSGMADGDVRRAIFAYNRADWYVDKVLAQAADYRAVPATNRPGGGLRLNWPYERATMPDPTSAGRLTPRTYTLARALIRGGMTGGGMICFGHRPSNSASDHPKGRACDVFFDPHDSKAVAEGWQLANWLIEHQATYGVHYIVWQGKFWSALDPQWVDYTSDAYGCPNPANVTGCHYDHLHWSIAPDDS